MHHVSVSDIGEFIQHKSCHRRFKLDHNRGAEFKALGLDLELSDIDPVLQASGARREDEWEASLRRAGLVEIAEPYPGEPGVEWMDFIQQLDLLDGFEDGFAREVEVSGKVGPFQIRGRMDFVLAGISNGRPFLRLIECKASRKDKTYHRVQAVLYRLMVRKSLSQMPVFVGGLQLGPEDVQCVVVRVDEETHAIQSILEAEQFTSADAIQSDVERLLSEGGLFQRILESDVESLPFQLEARCDSCKYAPHCFSTTTQRGGLEPLSLPPTTVRSLQAAGIADLNGLADLEVESETGAKIRRHPDFNGDLEALHVRALARRSTLDGKSEPVQWIPNTGFGQLPEHAVGDLYAHPRLIRVFLNVTYDYVENRIIGLSSHVTDSSTRCELAEFGVVEEDQTPLKGDVVRFKRAPWTGDYATDNGAELEMLQGFFRETVEAIEVIADESEMAAVHFYVWSRYELSQLLEAAARVGTGILGSLRELFGCRDKLEQLIYSALQFDVTTRYATGWTSNGLVPTVSLPWFGREFHWKRKIGAHVVDLAEVFHAGLFDFVQPVDGRLEEVRAHFADNLPAPYWHAYWGTLPEGAEAEEFEAARKPYVMHAYLLARVHALRWLEESIPLKNSAIAKKPMKVRDLPRFKLATENAVQAAVDFLRFDQHIAFTEWVREHLAPPWVRVANGMSVPVRDLRVTDDWGSKLAGFLDPETYGLTLSSLRSKCGLETGAFIRLNEVNDPHSGLSMHALSYGRTCIISGIDWETGRLSIDIIRSNDEDTYMPRSWNFSPKYPPWASATMDSSVADFVSRRVEERLTSGPGRRLNPQGAHVIEWFDPSQPSVPAKSPMSLTRVQRLLTDRMAPRRVDIVCRGLNARIQLVQGPPGTGKTTLTASALLMRALESKGTGVILVSANTHTAVDTLMAKTARTLLDWPELRGEFERAGRSVEFFKIGGETKPDGLVSSISTRRADENALKDRFNQMARTGAIAIIGGTTGGVLKFASTVGTGLMEARGTGLLTSLLVVDEASMMPFAHFLALASHVHPDGQIMLAGDHRQLSPIVAHDWAREDRPPTELYQPHVSAFAAIDALGARISAMPRNLERLVRDGLEVTYRLPDEIRALIQPVYTPDGIILKAPEGAAPDSRASVSKLEDIWKSGSLFLILHDEMGSRNSNRFEVELAQAVMASSSGLPDASVAVMTPHRAQRALLKDALKPWSREIAMVDTIERLQGGECPTILFSATVSDPVAITQNESFILDMNRSNVAFSRTKERLIVLCSRALLDHIPDSVEAYDAAILWKLLRNRCTVGTEIEVAGRRARILHS